VFSVKHRKFVKQLMAVGIERNMANQVAETARTKYGSYFKGLGLFLNTYAMLLNGQDPTCLYATAGGGGNE
jgi:hypothetical protein